MMTRSKAATHVTALGAAGAAALLAMACGSASAPPTSTTTTEELHGKHRDAGGVPVPDASAPPDGACHVLPGATPSSCWDWKFNFGFTSDGCYAIDPDAADGPTPAFEVHCAGMDGYAPSDYLDLLASDAPGAPPVNAATLSGAACGCADYTVTFDKVRLDLLTMTLRGDDRTFAQADDATCVASSRCAAAAASLGYGTAASCDGAGDASGSASVDLTGTPFHVASAALFTASGVLPGGSAAVSANRKTVTITGGGACGSFGSAAIPIAAD